MAVLTPTTHRSLMPTEEVQRTLDRIIGAVPVLASVGDALAKAAEAVSMPSLLGKLSTSMPSASAIGEAVMVAVRDHRREAVLCAAGLGVVVSCCALTAGSSAADDAATAARALAMQAEEAQRLDARQRRQREATARATQLKLEAQAARAAARELTALASEDERMLALAIAAAAKPVAGGGSSQPSPELGDNLPNGSPTKALRFAPSALSGAHTHSFKCCLSLSFWRSQFLGLIAVLRTQPQPMRSAN